MNKRTIEPAGALPSYDVNEMVVLTYEEDNREFICKVTGHARDEEELLYQLKDPLTGDTFTVPFKFLRPHIEDDLDDPDYLMRHDFGERGTSALDELDWDHVASGAFRGCFD